MKMIAQKAYLVLLRNAEKEQQRERERERKAMPLVSVDLERKRRSLCLWLSQFPYLLYYFGLYQSEIEMN